MITSLGTLSMIRTDPAHIGAEPLTSMMTQDIRRKQETETGKTRGAFEQYLLNAVNSVNDKQMASDAIAQQTVIDRVIKDWNEITTTR